MLLYGVLNVRVILIDGTFELFRSYFGAPSVLHENQEVGATRAFLRSLWKLVNEPTTTHVAVAFDSTVDSFRNAMFDGYKTGEGLEPELFSQFPLVEQATAALGVTVWPMVEYEADDALASGAALLAKDSRVQEIWIASPDKDLTQCVVGNRIVTWDRMRKKVHNEEAVIEKFGVTPQSIPDYLGLVGDAADGIPGIPRWGAKSTATVLAAYEHLEKIPRDETTWSVSVRGAKALASNLSEHFEDALLYRDLATLRTDVPLEADLETLAYEGIAIEALEAFCEQIGDGRFLERVRS